MYLFTGGQVHLPNTFKRGRRRIRPSDGCASTPISEGGVDDLRRLILRTLNDNQVLVLKAVAERRQSLTSLLRQLSMDHGVPLSTLKLNARILRELNLISYGSLTHRKAARLESLGRFVYRVIDGETVAASARYSD